MTLTEAKELERLKVQEAASRRAREFDEKEKEVDRTITRRSGAWHQTRSELAFLRIEADVDDRITIRRAMSGKCEDLLTIHEVAQFERNVEAVIEDSVQATLRNFTVVGVSAPASLLGQMPTWKSAMKQKTRTSMRMMQLEGPQPALPDSKGQLKSEIHSSGSFRFQIALSFPGEQRHRVQKIAEQLAVSLGKENILYDDWHKSEFARPNLDVYLPELYLKQSLLLVFFLCAEYVKKEWCGLEWRVGRELLKQKDDDRLMLLRLDSADIPGLYSIDGYLDIRFMPDTDVAVEILKRLNIVAAQSSENFSHASYRVVVPKTSASVTDPREYWEQRKLLPDTDIMKKIWSRPRWCIWIRPTEFRKARFQNLGQIREFIDSSYVRVQGSFSYPRITGDSLEIGDEWIAGEINLSHGDGMSRMERWALFRSGQFVHNRAMDDVPQLAGRFHVLEILDTATAALEFAGRMTRRGILSSEAAISFELYGVDGIELTWPEDVLGRCYAVEQACWSQDENVRIQRLVGADTLNARGRELALEVALEIYSRFGWKDVPTQRLINEQNRRFGSV